MHQGSWMALVDGEFVRRNSSTPEDCVLYIVRFAQGDDGRSGDLIDCTPIRNVGGLATYPLREGVATGGPEHPGVNVTIFAASDREAIDAARNRAEAYGRERAQAHRAGA